MDFKRTLLIAALPLAFCLSGVAQAEIKIKFAEVHPVGYPPVVAEQDMGNQEEFKQGLFEEAFGYIEKSRKLRPLDRAKNLRSYNDFHSSFRRMETVSAGSLLAKGLRGLYRKGAFLAVRQGRTDQNGATELRELVYVLLDMCQKPGAGALRQALHATARQELPGVLQSVARPTRKPRV